MFGGERIIKQPPGYHRLEAVKKKIRGPTVSGNKVKQLIK